LPPAPSNLGRACDDFVEAGHGLCKTDYGRHSFDPPLVSPARVPGGLVPMLRVVALRGRSSRVTSRLTGTVLLLAFCTFESGRFTDGRARASWPEADLPDPERLDLRAG